MNFQSMNFIYVFNELCCCSVTKLCSVLWDLIDYSTPGSSVIHCLAVCSSSHPLSQWCYVTSSEVGIILILFFKTVQSSFLLIPLTALAEIAPYYLMNLVDLIWTEFLWNFILLFEFSMNFFPLRLCFCCFGSTLVLLFFSFHL